MTELETEITRLEDKLGKLQAEKSATQITAHSGEFLHQNLRFAMEHIDKAPPDAQKGLIRALIKDIAIFDDKLQINMFVDQYIADTIPPHVKEALNEAVPINEKRPAGIASDEALNGNGGISPNRPHWLPTTDSEHYKRHLSKCKEIHILVKIYRHRGRGTSISLYDPLPSRPLPPPPVYKNIVAMAVQVREYLIENPQRTQTAAGNHFGVTRARVSQLMTIVENLPDEFISIMKTTKDQSLLKRFSGKTLLRIASMPQPSNRNIYIHQMMTSLKQSN